MLDICKKVEENFKDIQRCWRCFHYKCDFSEQFCYWCLATICEIQYASEIFLREIPELCSWSGSGPAPTVFIFSIHFQDSVLVNQRYHTNCLPFLSLWSSTTWAKENTATKCKTSTSLDEPLQRVTNLSRPGKDYGIIFSYREKIHKESNTSFHTTIYPL